MLIILRKIMFNDHVSDHGMLTCTPIGWMSNAKDSHRLIIIFENWILLQHRFSYVLIFYFHQYEKIVNIYSLGRQVFQLFRFCFIVYVCVHRKLKYYLHFSIQFQTISSTLKLELWKNSTGDKIPQSNQKYNNNNDTHVIEAMIMIMMMMMMKRNMNRKYV